MTLVLGAPIALFTFGTGWIQEGWDPPVVQCQHSDYPPGAPLEGGHVSGKRIYYPLGLSCTYGSGAQEITVSHYNWGSTATFTASAAAALIGAATLITSSAGRRARAEDVTESTGL